MRNYPKNNYNFARSYKNSIISFIRLGYGYAITTFYKITKGFIKIFSSKIQQNSTNFFTFFKIGAIMKK